MEADNVLCHNSTALLTAISGLANGTNSWIGLSQGIFTDSEDGFQWVDKTDSTYDNWAPFKPDGYGVIPGFVSRSPHNVLR